MKTMNHTEYPKHLKKCKVEELYYTIHDCKNAIRLFPKSKNCSYYADEINYCAMELRRRNLCAGTRVNAEGIVLK